ncbi:MAG: hypothetical protein V4509_00025 [Patescibacteria group bacterium]
MTKPELTDQIPGDQNLTVRIVISAPGNERVHRDMDIHFPNRESIRTIITARMGFPHDVSVHQWMPTNRILMLQTPIP